MSYYIGRAEARVFVTFVLTIAVVLFRRCDVDANLSPPRTGCLESRKYIVGITFNSGSCVRDVLENCLSRYMRM